MSGDQLSGDQLSGDQLLGDQLSRNQLLGDQLSGYHQNRVLQNLRNDYFNVAFSDNPLVNSI